MSSRPFIKPHSVIVDGDMSDDIISEVTIITNLSMVSYTCTWDGTAPVGAITVEVSDDYSVNADGSVRNPGSWVPLPDVSGSVSGDTGTGYIDILASSAYAIRLVYTASSGTGLLQAKVVAKVG